MSRPNSSYSDDGKIKNCQVNTDYIGRRSEEDKGLSLQVEYSDRGKATNFFQDKKSEEENEQSERRSTPPAIIESHEAMSEYIESSLHRLSKKGQTTFNYNPKLSATGVEKNVQMVSQKIGSQMSVGGKDKVHQWNFNQSKLFSKLHKRTYDNQFRKDVSSDNNHVIAFQKCYDRLFREFKEKLVQEYACMKSNYQSEYELNYQNNTKIKESNIEDANFQIKEKEEDIQKKIHVKRNIRLLMNNLFDKQIGLFWLRIGFLLWKEYREKKLYKKRVRAYSFNYMHRRKMRNLFCSWRGVTHSWFKERINSESTTFKQQKYTEYRVETYSKKMNALKLYMAQLQEKINIEVAAREELTKTYETSLNKGVGQLNDETRNLAENPLVKEISIIVAQELVRQSQSDPQLAQVIYSQNSTMQQIKH